jgi:hypothetical protein
LERRPRDLRSDTDAESCPRPAIVSVFRPASMTDVAEIGRVAQRGGARGDPQAGSSRA